MAEKVTNPYVEQVDGNQRILVATEAGSKHLETLVTDTKGDVYVITNEMSATIAAAAMARLSRSPNDMRVVILDEFSGEGDKEEGLLRRVITQFGDDSVQQLNGMHVVVEGASNLLTKKLEWGRLASYLEQSTRYIYFDEKDTDGKYRYKTPDGLPQDLEIEYTASMDRIFDLYSEVVHKLTQFISEQSDTPEGERDIAWKQAVRAKACDAARAMLPVSTKSTVGIYASAQALESMVVRMAASDIEEERSTAKAILCELRKVNPVFFERADKPDRGGATTAYLATTRHAMAELANELPSVNEPTPAEAVTLRNYVPPHELDLLAEMLYEHGAHSLDDIEAVLHTLPEEKRQEIFDAYFGERLNRRHKPGRALENAHYQFDVVCDYGIFRDLQRHRIVDDMNWQRLSTKLGFDIPELITEAGLEDSFNECFGIAEKLNACFTNQGLTEEAQYATLLGHKMRWKFTMNAREAFHMLELRTGPQGHTGYRKVAMQMYEAIKVVHPNIAKHMTFINKDEDPELGRLAAERATQYKLSRLTEGEE
jgi:thymidylate synthase ThyX